MADPPVERQRRAIANGYGLIEALFGVVAGVLIETVLVGIYNGARHLGTGATSSLGDELLGLLGLWAGFVGAAVVAQRRHDAADSVRRSLREALADGFGVRFERRDLPLGVAVGVASQFLLVPVAEAPLYPFVRHLYTRVGGPAHSLTSHIHGAGFVLLGIFVCIGSPAVEELFFRGLLLRGLLGSGLRRLAVLPVALPIVIDAGLFGLAHFEAIQFLGLAGFGVVLCVLAYRTGRLAPGFFAHASFNAVTFIALWRSF
jgi:membrane protease YdiL (CAAX protease family)